MVSDVKKKIRRFVLTDEDNKMENCMKKRIFAVWIMAVILINMVVPIFAASGDNEGSDNMPCSIYIKKDGVEGEYILGEEKVFKLELWASGMAGWNVTREFSVIGESEVDIRYNKETNPKENWCDIKEFNTNVTLKNDKRDIKIKFTKQGSYILTYKLSDASTKNVLEESYLYININDGKIEILQNKPNIKNSVISPSDSQKNLQPDSKPIETTKKDEASNKINSNLKEKIGKTRITKIKKSRKNIKIYVKKNKAVSGYQIQVSTNEKFKKKVTSKKIKSNKYTVRKLKSGKKYYVRVRGYIKKNRKVTYGNWTTTKIRTKK